jgi:hypothetical protein
MCSGTESIDFQLPIPIFPLPNTVLLPRAVLPLHLFEPRYRDMARDALDDTRLIATALLKEGYEESYHTHRAPIHPTVCVGRVLECERLPDGRYNLLLQGVCRAAIVTENQDKLYRRGILKPMTCADAEMNGSAKIARQQLVDLLTGELFSVLPGVESLIRVADCDELSTTDVVDVLAFSLIASPACRQAFLEESSLGRRT